MEHTGSGADMRRQSNPIIRHACGHLVSHLILYSNVGELSSKTFRLAQTECTECVMAKIRLAEELKLPPLRGTDRMIAWAANIRLTFAKNLRKYGASDAVEALRRITDAAWFIDNREQKLKSIIGMLSQGGRCG